MIQNNPRTNDRCLDDAEVVYDPEFGDRRILGVKYNDHFVTANQLAGIRIFINRYCSPKVVDRYNKFVAKPETLGPAGGLQVDLKKASQFECLLYLGHFVPYHTWEMADSRRLWDKVMNDMMEEVTTGWMQSELQRMEDRRLRREAVLGPSIMTVPLEWLPHPRLETQP